MEKVSKLFRPSANMLVITVLLFLTGICQGQSQVRVTVYDEPNFQGSIKEVTMNRCENIIDFNDRAKSIVTSGCVILYQDGCCQGPSLRITDNVAQFPPNFTDQLTSLSPCGFYRAPLPSSVQETWLGHGETMHKMVEDGDISIYHNIHMSDSALESHRNYLKRLWSYLKSIYGEFGPEGGRVSAFIHANVGKPTYGFNSLQNYFDIGSSCRNLIDLVGGPGAWSNNLTGVELDIVTHEISHIVEGASKGVHGSPSYRFWGDSKWAEIFIYDVYDALGMTEERDRFFRQVENGFENFPRPNTYWFRDWFYPIYKQNEGVQLLNNYFNLLAQHYPRAPNGWQYVSRSINLGEFVHFFSGAAGRDLESQARIAFTWDDDAVKELQQAKVDFPDIQYLGSNGGGQCVRICTNPNNQITVERESTV